MDYATLRIIHVTALAATFMGLTGLLALKLGGGSVPVRTRLIFHFAFGVGWLVIIVTGFMLANVLGFKSPPAWMMGKFVIWLLVGASMVLAHRFYRFAGLILIFFIALVATAAWLAIEKPF